MTGTAIAEASNAAAVAVAAPDGQRLVEAVLKGRSARTLRAYRRDLEAFQAQLDAPTVGEAVGALLAGGHGAANGVALTYRAGMVERGLSPATINRRLAALRSLVALANKVGVVPWTLAIENVRGASYRDTRGRGTDGYRALVEAAKAQGGTKAARDVPILRLLGDLGLRRAEAVELGAAVYALVSTFGKRAGLKARPHGLRHLAITTALDVYGGDVRAVQKFSRHADLRILNIYDDNRSDIAGEVAAKVAAMVATQR